MPQATDAQRAEWGDDGGCGEQKATRFLENAGYTLRRDWLWEKPNSKHLPTEKEIGAICFIIDEWDYGGIVDSPPSRFQRVWSFIQSFFTDNRPPVGRVGERCSDAVGAILYSGGPLSREARPLLINSYPEPHHRTREGRVVFDPMPDEIDGDEPEIHTVTVTVHCDARKMAKTLQQAADQTCSAGRASEAGIRAVRDAFARDLEHRMRLAEDVAAAGREILRKSLGVHQLPDGRTGELSVSVLPATLPAAETTPANPGDGNGEGGSTGGD